MHYLTDHKRAVGTGSARQGTQHFWWMTVSSYALLPLIILFIFTFGSALGRDYEEVAAYYSHPFPAIVAALTVTVGLLHFKNGARVMIEDYVHGYARELTIILVTCLSYTLIAIALFALARLAL